MDKKLFDLQGKLISVYYINNVPLLTLQKIGQYLKLYYKCDVSYFDSNFFFLKIVWNISIFKDKTINNFKNTIVLSDINSKQSFLLPVAVVFNKSLIGFSSFTKLFTFDKNFVSFEEISSYINTPIFILGQLEVFPFSPINDVFNYVENL